MDKKKYSKFANIVLDIALEYYDSLAEYYHDLATSIFNYYDYFVLDTVIWFLNMCCELEEKILWVRQNFILVGKGILSKIAAFKFFLGWGN